MSTTRIMVLIFVNIVAWLLIHIGCAWGGTKIPATMFRLDSRLYSIFPFERSGFFYERILGVRRWKDLLPDAAPWFRGGFPKRKLLSRDSSYLDQFIRETMRGETVHWIVFWSAALFYFWNPPWVVKWMFLYSAVANLPCIIIQRYNRNRLQHIQEQRDGI